MVLVYPIPFFHDLLRFEGRGQYNENFNDGIFHWQGKEVVKQILLSLIQEEEMQEFLIDTPVMKAERKKWLWLGVVQGKKEGMQEEIEKNFAEGHQAISDILHQILSRDFPIKPGKYQEYFDQLTLAELQQLSEVALSAKTLTDFEAALESILQEK